ncbi:MAG: peptide chain release factor 1 [Cyanobacteria bacterium J06638_20]
MRRNPLERLRQLPWMELLWIAALAVVIIFVIEVVLLEAARQILLVRDILQLLLTPPLGLLVIIGMGFCAGVLSVLLLENIRKDIIINSGVLWALVGCLMLQFLVRQSLSFLPALIQLNQSTLVGIVLGVFVQGKRYWR